MGNTTNADGGKLKSGVSGGYLPAGDNVKKNLLGAQATDDQVDSVLWLLTYGRQEKLGQISKLAERLNVSAPTLSKVFGGTYGADLGNLCEKIEHFRKLAGERATFGDAVVVTNLRVVKDVSAFCDLTRASQTMALLWGPNQSGKTWALKNIYAPANNHGRTIYVRMPTGGGTRRFLERVLKACGISERKGYSEMCDRVERYFDPSTLLIIDEMHQAMIGRSLKTTTIETIREIHDSTGCGVVLCGTDVVRDMIDDPKFSKLLGQTDNRGVLRRRIPPTPYTEDVHALCQAYGFALPVRTSDEGKLVWSIASKNGIGKLCKYFQMSRRLANGRREELEWKHFLATHATLASWEKGDHMREGGAE